MKFTKRFRLESNFTLFMMCFGTTNWRLLRLLGRTELKKRKINVKDQKGIFWLKTPIQVEKKKLRNFWDLKKGYFAPHLEFI